jgi:hypothetical protein
VKYFKHIIRSKLGWSLLVVHLVCAGFVVNEMPAFNEVKCSEAFVSSSLDFDLAGRSFFFNYSSSFATGLMIVDLPAIVVGYLAADLVPAAFGPYSGADLSWIRAYVILMTTSVQWFMLGRIGSVFTRWLSTKRRNLGGGTQHDVGPERGVRAL